jgi:hypothetical protein
LASGVALVGVVLMFDMSVESLVSELRKNGFEKKLIHNDFHLLTWLCKSAAIVGTKTIFRKVFLRNQREMLKAIERNMNNDSTAFVVVVAFHGKNLKWLTIKQQCSPGAESPESRVADQHTNRSPSTGRIKCLSLK